jgi:hypothetical protein
MLLKSRYRLCNHGTNHSDIRHCTKQTWQSRQSTAFEGKADIVFDGTAWVKEIMGLPKDLEVQDAEGNWICGKYWCAGGPVYVLAPDGEVSMPRPISKRITATAQVLLRE